MEDYLDTLTPEERAEVVEASKVHNHEPGGTLFQGWTCPHCQKSGEPLGRVTKVDRENGAITISAVDDG